MEFEQKRNAELAEVQRMEEAERRKAEEKVISLWHFLILTLLIGKKIGTRAKPFVGGEEDERESIRTPICAALPLQSHRRCVYKPFEYVIAPATIYDLTTSNKDRGYVYDTTVREGETQCLPWVFTQMDA